MAMVVYSADDSIHQEVLTAAQDLLKQGAGVPATKVKVRMVLYTYGGNIPSVRAHDIDVHPRS